MSSSFWGQSSQVKSRDARPFPGHPRIDLLMQVGFTSVIDGS
jgi:hypothetical protein